MRSQHPRLSEASLQAMTDELAVYQAELEQQNEQLKQSQHDLEAARAKYFRHYDMAPVGMLRLDLKGIILECNLLAASMLGHDRSMVLKSHFPFSNFLLHDSRHEFHAHLLQSTEIGTALQCNLHLRDGKIVRLQSTLVQDDGSNPEIVANLIDITELEHHRNLLSASEHQLREITASVPGVVFQIALSNANTWDFSFVSEGIRHLLDIPTSSPAVFSTLLDSLTKEDESTLLECLDTCRRLHTPLNFEATANTQMERRKWLWLRALPSATPEGAAVFTGTIQDIGDRKKQEDELKASREAALVAEKAKSDFLSVMSHELRTPMNGVIGYTDLLLSGQLSSEQREFTSYIHQSGEQLLHIVNQILDYSHYSGGGISIHYHPFAATTLFQKVVEMFRKQAQVKQLAIQTHLSSNLPDKLLGDEQLLLQVLGNIVGNSIKFTPSGSIDIYTSYEPRGAMSLLQIIVEDTGVGISPELMSKLFLPFEQADNSTTRRFCGTGLGLAISKKICDAMQGTIQITPREGKGTRCTISLPIESAGHQKVYTASKVAEWSSDLLIGANHPLSILVVEDIPTNLILLKNYLQLMGYTCTMCSEGGQAIEIAKEKHYDVVLLDLQMPGINGYDVARQIREIESTRPNTPRSQIIAVTAHVLPEDKRKACDSGMNDFIGKPIRLPLLKLALQQAYERLTNTPGSS